LPCCHAPTGFITANGAAAAAAAGPSLSHTPTIHAAANITNLLLSPPDTSEFASDIVAAEATAALLQPFEQDVTLSTLSFNFDEAEDVVSSNSSSSDGGIIPVGLKGKAHHKQKPKYRVYRKEGHIELQEHPKDNR
jgi:hypothetical protein